MAPMPPGSDPGERAGEEFELDAAGLKLGGQHQQLGRVAREPLELVHREDDRRLGRGLLELAGQSERLLQLGPHLDAGADLLLEDLVALRAVEGFADARTALEMLPILTYEASCGRSRSRRLGVGCLRVRVSFFGQLGGWCGLVRAGGALERIPAGQGILRFRGFRGAPTGARGRAKTARGGPGRAGMGRSAESTCRSEESRRSARRKGPTVRGLRPFLLPPPTGPAAVRQLNAPLEWLATRSASEGW